MPDIEWRLSRSRCGHFGTLPGEGWCGKAGRLMEVPGMASVSGGGDAYWKEFQSALQGLSGAEL